jgi:kumamolisin
MESSMSQPQSRQPIRGSERAPVAGAHPVGPTAPDERIEVTVRVRRRSAGASLGAGQAMGGSLPRERRYLSRAELAATHGADPADIAKIEEFAHEHGLDVVEASLARRTVRLSGTARSLSDAFGVQLQEWEGLQGRYRGREGAVHVPSELQDIVVGVFGLDNRPQARPHLRRLGEAAGAARPRAGTASFTPVQLAQLYNFPSDVQGQGECIAIIELGGGYRASDLEAYFGQLGLPVPTVSAVSVDGGHNNPTNANSADGEVMLDIEVAGAIAPAAQIVVYFAPNTDAGFLDAITTAVHDTLRNPSVISISWGAPEKEWTQQAMQNMDDAFQEAATVGVTVFSAAGDDGSSDRENDGLAHADFPASSPNGVGCGGTNLEVSGGSIVNEVVWNGGPMGGAGGGGISDAFGLPSYQSDARVPPSANSDRRVGRGVPDVAGDADPASGYQVRVDGQDLVFGGTSAVAPLWAGLTALLNQKLGKPVGFLNPLLYGVASSGLRDITAGDNGAYAAGPGWDACTGLGSPDGAKLLAALGGPS